MSVREARRLALTRIGRFHVALDADEVGEVREDADSAELVDLAQHLRIATPDRAGRRVARLVGRPRAVLLGASMRLVEVPRDAFHPVPPFLAEHLARLAVHELVSHDGALAYLLSIDGLFAR